MRAHVTVAKPIGRIAITVPKGTGQPRVGDRKSTRLNSSHGYISYAVFCLKKKTSVHGRLVHRTESIYPLTFATLTAPVDEGCELPRLNSSHVPIQSDLYCCNDPNNTLAPP